MANKLELTWVGKDKQIKIEPRLLIENAALSNTAKDKSTENMLIHGDNLLALKALEQKFAGQVKCIYIDPPYNTGAAFEHYDDNLEHSIWLGLMRERLLILKNLLKEDGSIWISIDDDEGHYLKVLCDEIFGRNNFINTVIWHKKHTRANDAKWFSDNHDFILIYAVNKAQWHPNLLPRSEERNSDYSNPDNDPRGVWQSLPLQAKSGTDENFTHTFSNGVVWKPPAGRYSAFSHESLEKMEKENRIWFGKKGKNVPRYKKFLSEVKDGFVPTTLWFREEVGDNQEAKTEVKNLFVNVSFDTPKPERLIERIMILASDEGDLVLDSFLGSGTTAAVAHKMGRRYIGVELGDHAYTHCKVRLDKVIEGEQGGISKEVDWKGGGGYRFYELAPTLINKDDLDEEIINTDYNADMLAAAVALHEGFKYEPDGQVFWKQSKGTENSYLFVTTKHITRAYLMSIAATMGDNEHLVIACKTFDKNVIGAYKNIMVKKIPEMLLNRCEFGKVDYNLNIINPPVYEEDEEE